MSESDVLLGDLHKVYQLRKKTIRRWVLLGALLCGFFSLLLPIKYEVKAIFKEDTGSSAMMSLENPLAAILQATSGASMLQDLVKARPLIRRTVEKSGIQIARPRSALPFRVVKRIRRHLDGGYNKRVAYAKDFVFSNVSFQGMGVTSFKLKATSNGLLECIDAKGNKVFGRCGEAISLSNVRFTVSSVPESMYTTWHRFEVTGEEAVTRSLLKGIQVKPMSTGSQLLVVTMKDGRPAFAQHFLSHLLNEYTAYLREESDRVSGNKEKLLRNRLSTIECKLDGMVADQVESMKENIDQWGFLDEKTSASALYGQEGRLWGKRQEAVQLLWELKRGIYSSQAISPQMKKIVEEKEKLIVKKHLLSAEMAAPLKMPILSQQRTETVMPLHSLQQRIRKAEVHMRQSGQFYEGVDRYCAEELYKKLLKDLQRVHFEKELMTTASEQLNSGVLALSSLQEISPLVKIPKILNTDKLSLGVSNKEHFSEKERASLKKQINIAKNALQEALKERRAVLTSRKKHLLSELAAVKATLALQIDKEILLLSNKIAEMTEQAKAQAKEAIRSIDEELAKVAKRMKGLPERWAARERHEFEKNYQIEIIGQLAAAMETNSMSSQYASIGSTVVDEPMPPKKPSNFPLLVFVVAGAGLGGILSSAVVLVAELIRGLPISGPGARVRGYRYLGMLTEKEPTSFDALNGCDRDLFRKMSGICLGGVYCVARGFGPDVAATLAHVIRQQEKTVCVVRIDTDQVGSVGIVQFLDGKVDSLKLEEDTLVFGGAHPFAAERLRSKKMLGILDDLEQRYDVVLIDVSAPFGSEETRAATELCDHAIVVVHDEAWEEVRELRELEIPLTFIDY